MFGGNTRNIDEKGSELPLFLWFGVGEIFPGAGAGTHFQLKRATSKAGPPLQPRRWVRDTGALIGVTDGSLRGRVVAGKCQPLKLWKAAPCQHLVGR